MLIKVADIPDEGLGVELSEDEEGLGGLVAEARLAGLARASFRLKVVEGTVFVTGMARAAVGLECSRCGRPFETEIDAEFTVDLHPVDSLAGEDEKELKEGDLDVGFYSGGEVDLTALLAEQIELNLPMQPLCSEGCKGVCQYCGQDRNVKECGCKPPSGHPGFEGLRGLLDDMKKTGGKKRNGKSD